MTCVYDFLRSTFVATDKAKVRVAGRLALPFLLAMLGASCGDVYRPVALPIPAPSPTPAPVAHIFAVSSNGSAPNNTLANPGSINRIDVSGDSVVSSIAAGVGSIHAALTTNGARIYVVNSVEDTVFASPTNTSPQGTTVNLVQLCDSAGCPPITPVFVHTTEIARMYVADEGNGTISVIDTTSVAVVNTFAVAPGNAGSPLPLPDRNSKPVALAELPNGTKIYALNKGTNSVSSINTQDGFINKVIALGATPQWAVANPDNAHVYVIDSAGTISVIDSRTDTVVSSVSAGSAGTKPNHIAYDPIYNRVFATAANSPQPAVATFDVSGTSANPNSTLVPHGPGTALITPAAGSTCASVPVPAAITVLGDGSRAYVASYQDDGTQICTQATVIDTGTGLVTKTVALSQTGLPANAISQTNCDVARFRVYATSSNGSTNSNFKVYVSQCDAGTVAIVDTFAVPTGPDPHPSEWLAGWLASPVSTFPGSQVSIIGVSAPQVTCPAPTQVAYSYSLLNGPALQPGMTIYIGGMSSGANDGAFPIMTATGSSFTVTNICPAPDSTAQNGTGAVLPPQNPVFLVPGP